MAMPGVKNSPLLNGVTATGPYFLNCFILGPLWDQPRVISGVICFTLLITGSFFTDVTDEVWPPPHVLAAQMSLIRMAKVFKGRLVGWLVGWLVGLMNIVDCWLVGLIRDIC